MDASIDATSARHEAAQGGYLDVVEALVDAGAFLDMKSDDGNTPVHRAAWYGHVHVVTSLTSVGANLSLRNNNGETALHLAAARGRDDVVNILINNGGDIDSEDNSGSTPLESAQRHKGSEGKGIFLHAAAADTFRPFQVHLQDFHLGHAQTERLVLATGLI